MSMGSLDTPKTWVPYINTKDCSQGFCSVYCPQWCYIIFPPPPPPFDFPDDDSGPNFSPLVIVIIGILASAFLLVSYYAIVSKFCGRRSNHIQDMVLNANRDPSDHGHPNVSTNGLDEPMIKSISMFKYKKGDGLIEGTDCSVCLSEFQENESLRLLPKCSHAFHVTCIDTWLKSHSSCPLCRANIAVVNSSPRELPPPVMEPLAHDIEIGVRAEEIEVPTSPIRDYSDHGNPENGSSITDIRDDEDYQVGRSVSMDNPSLGRVSIADILRTIDDEVGTSTQPTGEMCRSSNRSKVLHCVMSPVAMKRSNSSGRFAFSKRGRGRNVIPF